MLSIERRSLVTSTHGHFLVAAPDGPGPHPLLVGFHGYGQSAEQHLAELRQLPGAEGFVLVAVQGLHLFYTRKGDVVASWMTKRGREEAIADNVAYVDAVVTRVAAEFAATGPIVYLGFSQGASMAYRAAALGSHGCHGVIAVGGDLPPDLAAGDVLRLPPVLVVRGERDEWFTGETVERDLGGLRRHGVAVRSVEFAGGHAWDPAFFPAVAEFLREATSLE